MSARKMIAALAVAVTALATPGYAEDAEKGVKVGADIAGSISKTTIYQQLSDEDEAKARCIEGSQSTGGASVFDGTGGVSPSVTNPDISPDRTVDCLDGGPGALRTDSPGTQNLTGYVVSGNCTFGGVLTPQNRLNITYGGAAKATGPQVPQLTAIRCTISNAAGTHSAFSEFAFGGPASATSSAQNSSVPTNSWPVSPVTVCVEGFGIYGPTPVVIVTLPKTCNALLA